MKRTAAMLGFVLSLALAGAAIADESFILDIPVRGNAQQETGRVKITLTLSAAPAGAQLVVNGNTTLTLGQTQSVGGDSVTFETATGNDVRILYTPLSNFSGGNFCAGGNAVEKQIPMRFVGAQDVTAYRISSYIVASPMVECSDVSKHTGDTPAFLTPMADGVAPALTATNLGRHPFDVVLVLDKSGSMADFPPGAMSGAKKHEILKSAVEGFIVQWRQVDLPPGGGPEWSHDRLGVVFFDHNVAAQSIAGGDPPANFFVKRGSVLPGNWDNVINDVKTLTPGGATSIGGGVNEGMKQWKADPANDLSLVVVTDGMQNTAPLIQPTGSGFLGLTPVSGLPQELRKRFIPIQTIGFGTPAQIDEDLLRNISFETNGVSYMSANASTMFDVLGMTLVAILKGNTVSLATNHHGTMTGKGPSAPLPVVVDSSAQRVVFSVQWAPPLREALDLEVFRPGTSTPAAPASAEKLPQGSFQTFNLHTSDIGKWAVRVKRGLNTKPDPVPYTLNVLFLERHLDYRFQFDQIHATTGDKLGIHATVSWDGKPLTGLPSGAIRVVVGRQREGLGNILHDARVRDKSTGNTTTPAGDVQTPLDRKVASLINRGLLERIAQKEVATIALKEEGRGVYSAIFDGTTVPGTYGFKALLDWEMDRTGHVHREERLEVNVTVKPDRDKTDVQTTRPDARTVAVAVTPRDRLGNFLGPGFASLIKARLFSEGKLLSETPVDRDQIGTYVFTLAGVPGGQTPDIEIVVDGVVVHGSARKS